MKKIVLLTILLAYSLMNHSQIVIGNQRMEEYLPMLTNKNIGVVCNQTSVVEGKHLVDTLLDRQIKIKKIFSLEHGFKGDKQAGEMIDGQMKYKDTIEIVSLYGKNKKPTDEQLQGLDIVLFDVQDVGCRFYTYISSLEYILQACSQNNKQVIVLDRPNPNNFIAGPVLENSCKSFVGMQNIPICYGLTIGEYATMINEEHWIGAEKTCNLKVITMLNYQRDSVYDIDIFPSPNLKTMQAIRNYPTLCLFEGTDISVGRGTNLPFEVIGFDKYPDTSFSFMPVSIKGVSENPPYKNKKCYGQRVNISSKDIELEYLIKMYQTYDDKEKFFNKMFNLLAGNKTLINQIQQGLSEQAIKQTWQKDIQNYTSIRNKYLFY